MNEKIYPALSRSTVMENPYSLFGYFAWPSVARLHDGRLAAAASGFRQDHVCPWGKSVICFSSDEGRTWTLPAPVIDTILDDRDSGVVPLDGDRVMVTSFNTANRDMRQWLDGYDKTGRGTEGFRAACRQETLLVDETGLEEEQFGSTYRISEDNCTTFGPLFHSPVTCPHGPLYMPDGRILYIGNPLGKNPVPCPKNELQCWEVDGKGGAEYLCHLEPCSDELGQLDSWEPHAVCLPDGTILVHIRAERSEPRFFSTWQCESHDGGRSFTKPHRITGPLGGAPAHLLRLSDGRLISAVGDREYPYGIRILTSRDQGQTWDSAKLDAQLPAVKGNWDLGYPASVELRNGHVFTLWYQRSMRHGPAGLPDASGPAIIRGMEWDPND